MNYPTNPDSKPTWENIDTAAIMSDNDYQLLSDSQKERFKEYIYPSSDSQPINMADANFVASIIKPETNKEWNIVSDPLFVRGALWGKPRNGHPEGMVLYHIRDVLKNIDDLKDSKSVREALRLIAIVHDTFKYKVDRSQPKSGENHHAMIARRFAQTTIPDTSILDVIELHDEAYNAWLQGKKKGSWGKTRERYFALAKRLSDRPGKLELFIKFYACDNASGNKSSEDFAFFLSWLKYMKNEQAKGHPFPFVSFHLNSLDFDAFDNLLNLKK